MTGRIPFAPRDETVTDAVEGYLTRLESMHPSPRLQRAIDKARSEFYATLASDDDAP